MESTVVATFRACMRLRFTLPLQPKALQVSKSRLQNQRLMLRCYGIVANFSKPFKVRHVIEVVKDMVHKNLRMLSETLTFSWRLEVETPMKERRDLMIFLHFVCVLHHVYLAHELIWDILVAICRTHRILLFPIWIVQSCTSPWMAIIEN